jgi:glycosyltransferase involved in cell wall biosynthesis
VNQIPSLHIVASKEMGGAERWFVRFLRAMLRQGQQVEAVVRTGSELARHHLEGIPTRSSPMRTVWDPWSRYRLNSLIRANGAPIVQTYMGRATRLTRLPFGGGQVHVSRLGGYYKIAPFRHAHAWIGNTRGLCDWLVQQGLPAARVFHIYNFAEAAKPVDADQIQALRARIDATREDFLMVTAGRLIDVKGHRYLIDALARLPEEVSGRRPRLLVLGDGPLLASLQEQARQSGVERRILWLGWQRDPAPWFHVADMVVFTSRDAETLGNVILEAWAYGKPLLTTSFRGAREIARHGEDAWVVPCDNARELTAGMLSLIRDETLGTALVRAGLERVERDFAEATIIAQYQALYRHLLPGR